MSARPLCWMAAAVLALLATAACGSTNNAQTNRTPTSTSSQRMSQNTSAGDTSETATDLEALYWARKDSARMDFTEADVRFMTGMIGHHAQAVVMSRLAPTHGASEQVQTLAARIINAQQDEIASMQRWLRERGQHVPNIEIEGTRLLVDGTSGHSRPMAGILTKEQIQELDAARGAAFDRLFLTYMIEHHSGAVTMVDHLFSTDGAGQDDAAFKLASDINVDQTTEINRMKRMLRALPEAPSDS